MAKQTGSPEWMEGHYNKATKACIGACKADGTIGVATANVHWEGDYYVKKDGEFTLDLDVGADIPDNIPVEADVGTEIGKKREKGAKGKLVVSYTVTVRTAEGG